MVSPPFARLPKGNLPLKPELRTSKFAAEITNVLMINGASLALVKEILGELDKFDANIKPFYTGVDATDNAVRFARFLFFFQRNGVSAAKATQVLVLVVGLKSPDSLMIIDRIVRNAGRLGPALKRVGSAANGVNLVMTAITCYGFIVKGQWGQLFGELYKTGMSSVIPWAGGINAIQAFVEAIIPTPSPRVKMAFDIVKAIDPIGLGGMGVQSIVFFVQAIFDYFQGKTFDEARFAELVERMKTGPTAVFADIGDKAGSAAYDIAQMNRQDWTNLGRYTHQEMSNLVSRWFGK